MTALLLACVLGLADDLADLRARADRGDADAMFELGLRYHKGEGVERDDKTALQWHEKAAAEDHTKAEVQLGYMHAHGFGTKLDFAQAAKWYRRAALKGDTTAEHNMGLQYLHGQGVKKDAELAYLWFRRAATRGHARAQFNLAECHEKGVGTERDSLRAATFYSLAARHPEQERIFGKEKAAEVIRRRDHVLGALKEEERDRMDMLLPRLLAVMAVHPRKFGLPGGVGTVRGWYVWEKWSPTTGQAVVRHETRNTRHHVEVLPWATTYRRLAYGASPDALLPGERVNLFFESDGVDPRGRLVHFQDEIGQMKGHGHIWEVLSVDEKGFTAHVRAGDRPLDGKEHAFTIDPRCERWRAGKLDEKHRPAKGDRLYLTWVSQEDGRVVKLLTDEASLEAIRKLEQERVEKQGKEKGYVSWVEMIEGNSVHVLIAATHWQQVAAVKEGQEVSFGPERALAVVGWVTFRKNRGTYGSGPTDMLIELKAPADVTRVREMLDAPRVRLFVR
jgi:hypothetical protein